MEFNPILRTKRLAAFKKLPSHCVVPKSEQLPYYYHLTFAVSTLSEYINVINLLNSKSKDSLASDALAFRGMADYTWKMIPSFARIESLDIALEHEMVNEFITLKPDEFQNLNSDFQLLAKMQHYGLPTRLLDFTTNPLIALYFACASLFSKDARVVCGNAYLEYNNSALIEAICGSYRPYTVEKMRLESLLADTGVSPYDYIHKVYLLRDYRLMFAKPQYWNQRIINQSAIFLVYPNKLYDVIGEDACYYNTSELDDKSEMHTEKEVAQIREVAKQEPLEQIYPLYVLPSFYDEEKDATKLHDFTVTYKTMQDVFSSHREDNIYALDAKGSALYTERGKTLFDKRFMFLDQIQEIDADTLREHFCSIIIKKKYKESILKELEAIGIDKAFIFPELEYTAEKIRMKYM